jgi:hypothetical protein
VATIAIWHARLEEDGPDALARPRAGQRVLRFRRRAGAPARHALPRPCSACGLRAIALAHIGIVTARGWCANSPIARVRLAGENERLEAKLASLLVAARGRDSCAAPRS